MEMNIIINSIVVIILMLVETKDEEGLYYHLECITRHMDINGIYIIARIVDKIITSKDSVWLRERINSYLVDKGILSICIEDIKHIIEDEGNIKYQIDSDKGYIKVNRKGYCYLKEILGEEVIGEIVVVGEV